MKYGSHHDGFLKGSQLVDRETDHEQ
jgi:hypothetical protein